MQRAQLLVSKRNDLDNLNDTFQVQSFKQSLMLLRAYAKQLGVENFEITVDQKKFFFVTHSEYDVNYILIKDQNNKPELHVKLEGFDYGNYQLTVDDFEHQSPVVLKVNLMDQVKSLHLGSVDPEHN